MQCLHYTEVVKLFKLVSLRNESYLDTVNSTHHHSKLSKFNRKKFASASAGDDDAKHHQSHSRPVDA